MKISVDSKSGYCPGVSRAIETAEQLLNKEKELYCLGSIVHNNIELQRLKSMGLEIVDHTDLNKIEGSALLIRAHGEPPSTYQLAESHKIKLIDCTCPVVLRLQKKIKDTYLSHLEQGGQIIIFGKKGHAEVEGLIGQVKGDGHIVENSEDIEKLLQENKIDLNKPIFIFTQTTKEPDQYETICNKFREIGTRKLHIYNSICNQVTSRHAHLKEFSKSHSHIVFVGGKESSNGKVLYNLCLSVNSNTHFIEKTEDINLNWFEQSDSIGICGATSTPKWQLEKVFSYICESLEKY